MIIKIGTIKLEILQVTTSRGKTSLVNVYAKGAEYRLDTTMDLDPIVSRIVKENFDFVGEPYIHAKELLFSAARLVCCTGF